MYRVTNVIDHQVRSLRRRTLIAGYVDQQRLGAYWGIRTDPTHYPVQSSLAPDPALTAPLADVATRMKPLDPGVAHRLVNWGYAACDTALGSHVVEALGPAAYPFEGGVG